jgi:hypothetical protein
MKRTRGNHGAACKAQVALAACKGDKNAGGVGGTRWRASHPDHRMEAAFAGAGRRRVWRHNPQAGRAGSTSSIWTIRLPEPGCCAICSGRRPFDGAAARRHADEAHGDRGGVWHSSHQPAASGTSGVFLPPTPRGDHPVEPCLGGRYHLQYAQPTKPACQRASWVVSLKTSGRADPTQLGEGG